MSTSNPWLPILTASSTGRALQLALAKPPGTLPRSPLPLPPEELSKPALENLATVHRALALHIPALSHIRSASWAEWKRVNDEYIASENQASPAQGTGSPHKHPTPRPLATAPDKSRPTTAEPAATETAATAPTKPNQVERVDVDHSKKTGSNMQTKQAPTAASTPAPTGDEVRAADVLHEWALKAMHTTPPADAVETVCRSGEAATGGRVLLTRIVGGSATDVSSGSAVVGAITALCDGAGAGLALGIVQQLVVPYVGALRMAAPRDMIAAMERFGARHWRAAIQLFEWAGARDAKLNPFASEVLARTAAVVPGEGGADCLYAFCKAGEAGGAANWGEDGVRLVDGMVERCGANERVGAALVPALERNIIGMEKSVKFGKLLFTTARDVPGVTAGGRFREAFEAVCVQSKGFLAKRALGLIKKAD